MRSPHGRLAQVRKPESHDKLKNPRRTTFVVSPIVSLKIKARDLRLKNVELAKSLSRKDRKITMLRSQVSHLSHAVRAMRDRDIKLHAGSAASHDEVGNITTSRCNQSTQTPSLPPPTFQDSNEVQITPHILKPERLVPRRIQSAEVSPSSKIEVDVGGKVSGEIHVCTAEETYVCNTPTKKTCAETSDCSSLSSEATTGSTTLTSAHPLRRRILRQRRASRGPVSYKGKSMMHRETC